MMTLQHKLIDRPEYQSAVLVRALLNSALKLALLKFQSKVRGLLLSRSSRISETASPVTWYLYTLSSSTFVKLFARDLLSVHFFSRMADLIGWYANCELLDFMKLLWFYVIRECYSCSFSSIFINCGPPGGVRYHYMGQSSWTVSLMYTQLKWSVLCADTFLIQLEGQRPCHRSPFVGPS